MSDATLIDLDAYRFARTGKMITGPERLTDEKVRTDLEEMRKAEQEDEGDD